MKRECDSCWWYAGEGVNGDGDGGEGVDGDGDGDGDEGGDGDVYWLLCLVADGLPHHSTAEYGVGLQLDSYSIERKRQVHILLSIPYNADFTLRVCSLSHRCNEVRERRLANHIAAFRS